MIFLQNLNCIKVKRNLFFNMLKILFIFIFFVFFTSVHALDIKQTVESTIENNPKIKRGIF